MTASRLPSDFKLPVEDQKSTDFLRCDVKVFYFNIFLYGLAESRLLRVLQQRPMTVILADEVELALEHAVARYIWVEKDTGGA